MKSKDKGIGVSIDLPDGRVYFQRYAPVTETEEPLTEQEEVILFLYSRYEIIQLQLEQRELEQRIKDIMDEKL